MARSLTVQHEENLKPSGLFLFFLGAAAVVLALSGYAADEPALAAEPPAPAVAPAPL